MVAGATFACLQREPGETRLVGDMHRRPAIGPVFHIGGNALLPGEGEQSADQTLLDCVMHLRKPYYDGLNPCLRMPGPDARKWRIRRVVLGGGASRGEHRPRQGGDEQDDILDALRGARSFHRSGMATPGVPQGQAFPPAGKGHSGCALQPGDARSRAPFRPPVPCPFRPDNRLFGACSGPVKSPVPHPLWPTTGWL